MRKIFPDRSIEDLQNNDEIFHVLYDLNERFQVPGYQYIGTGRTYERDGIDPKWRAIRDDKGRIMVAICHTCTSATPGSMLTIRDIQSTFPHWLTA